MICMAIQKGREGGDGIRTHGDPDVPMHTNKVARKVEFGNLKALKPCPGRVD